MKNDERPESERPALLDVVALLADHPGGLARGQVGTVVETLDEKTVLVEFSDDEGHAYAVAPCPNSELLVLHYAPEAA
jgi:hypothetical protein